MRDESTCGTLKDTSELAKILGFVSEQHFVRLEALRVTQAFQKQRQDGLLKAKSKRNGRQFVLVGSPGVDESFILARPGSRVAIKRQRAALLLRNAAKEDGKPPVLFPFRDGKFYTWQGEGFSTLKTLRDALQRETDNSWVCLDDFEHGELKGHDFQAMLRVLTTCGMHHVVSEHCPTNCLSGRSFNFGALEELCFG